ncbi:hypothetical protein [Latilactobacillus graminis]|uniref:Uncharacterized protein n=2 Tax=Latilactobacillus graminis TaxID=60519 RepID=A0AA89KW57_9LACO|nr:hypothetical protein [Latilactobacillus graminis]KRM20684.1 hypothetical protein FC90_GL000047 [Latilactobacillus graminis DSM 20719]QFP79949.1 hypothetical protein LG542_06675 [Latilactobacillus graminis]
MPFLIILLVIIAVVAAVGVFSLLIGSLLLLLKFALPLLMLGVLISIIYRAITGPKKQTQHAYSNPTSGSHQRKEARDVKVDDDDWSDF